MPGMDLHAQQDACGGQGHIALVRVLAQTLASSGQVPQGSTMHALRNPLTNSHVTNMPIQAQLVLAALGLHQH